MGSLGFQHSRQIGVFLSGDEGVFLQYSISMPNRSS